MAGQIEDEDYLVSNAVDDFAIADEAALDSVEEDIDDDELEQNVNAQAINEIRQYLKDNIAVHNSFDVLQLPQNAKPEEKIAVFDEMFNHKGIVYHLRQIEQIINTKVKEN